jgi:hypothetical protein
MVSFNQVNWFMGSCKFFTRTYQINSSYILRNLSKPSFSSTTSQKWLSFKLTHQNKFNNNNFLALGKQVSVIL